MLSKEKTITLSQALKIAEKEVGCKAVKVYDCGDRWDMALFECDIVAEQDRYIAKSNEPSWLADFMNTVCDPISLFVLKADGKILKYDFYNHDNYVEVFKRRKEVALPK